MLETFRDHWPEYLIEAWCLGTFMLSACAFATMLFHPDSPLAESSLTTRNILMGLAMGLTAVSIIKSPWGQRSGAHFNPAVTITFLRLRKIEPADAAFYILFQFAGGIAGVLLSWLLLGDALANSAVNFVVTVPGKYGASTALTAEFAMSFVLMAAILFTSNNERTARLTPLIAASLVAIFIAAESPVSGMSLNPARTFASAIVAGNWTAVWIYFVAPTMAMLAAAEFFLRTRGLKEVACTKRDHTGAGRCILNCEFGKVIHRRDAETQRRRETKRKFWSLVKPLLRDHASRR